MADKYFRLITLIVNVCPGPFRELFIYMARNESNKKHIPFTDIDNYLKQQSTKVHANPRFTRDQLNMLYPPPPDTTEVKNWDLTLLSELLETLFAKGLGPAVRTCIKKLRRLRNDLMHKTSTLSISDTDFQQMWKDITAEIVNMASVVGGPKYEKEIKIEITNVEKSFTSTLGGVLLKWYNSVLLETKVTTEHIREDTQCIKTLLEGTAVKRRRRSGSELNHFRGVNYKQDALIRNFKTTKDACRDFDSSPQERVLSKISKRLTEHNFVIVSGHENCKYLEYALCAVQSLNLPDSCCAELNRPEELFIINGEEVELLLLQSSFLSTLLGKEREVIMFTLNRLQYHISHGDHPLKVVMLSDQAVFEKFRDQYNHQLLTTAIAVHTPTSLKNPIDLSKNDKVAHSDTTRNMLVWSSLFLQEREMTFHDDEFLTAAEHKFQEHNYAVCIGESSFGRSALAVYLAKLNQSSECLVITDPDELKYVELGKINVLVILDFAGRFRYDETKVYKWLEKFDLLYDAVRNRMLSVIITSQESRLRMCREEIASHILLEQTIHIPQGITMTAKKASEEKALISGDRGENVSREESIPNRENRSQTEEVDHGMEIDLRSIAEQDGGRNLNDISDRASDPVFANDNVIESSPVLHAFEALDVEIKQHNITLNDAGDDYDSCVWGLCQLPDRSFVLLDYYKQMIKQFDATFKYIKHLPVEGSAKSICCTGHNQITIAFEKALTVLNVKSENCTTQQTDVSPDMLTSDLKNLFVMDKTNRIIYAYDLNTFSVDYVLHVPVVETYSPAFCNSLAISQSGEKFYIVYLDMIKCFNKYGVVLATYEMPVNDANRKYRTFTQSVMCEAGGGFLLFISQGNKEQTNDRFIFLDSSLNETQKGSIQSDSIKAPAVMCFDKHDKRAIIGYKTGKFITDVHFAHTNTNMVKDS